MADTSSLQLMIALETFAIVLFAVMFLGSLIAPRGREILFHGFIAGLVGAGLAIFDLLMRHLIGENPENAALWQLALAVFGIFLAIFIAVVGLQVLQENRSIPMEDLGVIDGEYIDAVYDDSGNRCGCSVITITSAQRSGFTIRGTAYDETPAEVGKFDGAGSISSTDGLCYHYRGHEKLTSDDGVCYYRFSAHGGTVTFAGGFMAFGLKTSRRVRGRQLSRAERFEMQRDQKGFLKRYLDNEAPKKLS